MSSFPDELLPGVSPAGVAAAIGICVSMKALPVLAAILRGEIGLSGSRISHLALGVAGVNDIALWVLLGIVLTVAAAGHAGHSLPAVWLLALAPIYLFVMVQYVRPVLARMVSARIDDGDEAVTTRGAIVDRSSDNLVRARDRALGTALHHRGLRRRTIMPADLHKPILDRLQVMTVALLMPSFSP